MALNKPADTITSVKENGNYAWPYCHQSGARIFADERMNPRGSKFDCRKAAVASAAFPPHSSPLGLEYFDSTWSPPLTDSFLVALHGSTTKSLNRGYKVVSIAQKGEGRLTDFLTGFIQNGVIHGRPADIFRLSNDAFLVTDDRAGVVYYIRKR